jgi:hypothetical protein
MSFWKTVGAVIVAQLIVNVVYILATLIPALLMLNAMKG